MSSVGKKNEDVGHFFVFVRAREVLCRSLKRMEVTEQGNISGGIRTGVAGDGIPKSTSPSVPYIKKERKKAKKKLRPANPWTLCQNVRKEGGRRVQKYKKKSYAYKHQTGSNK